MAFDLAMNFYVLAGALCARPVGVALLPRLSRLTLERQMVRFREELVRGASLMFFLAVPAAVGLAVLAGPIAEAITFGRDGFRRRSRDAELCAPGPLLRGDRRLRAAVVHVRVLCAVGRPLTPAGNGHPPSIAACGIGAALTLPQEPMLLLALGLIVSIADLVGATFLALRLRSALPSGEERLLPPFCGRLRPPQ